MMNRSDSPSPEWYEAPDPMPTEDDESRPAMTFCDTCGRPKPPCGYLVPCECPPDEEE